MKNKSNPEKGLTPCYGCILHGKFNPALKKEVDLITAFFQFDGQGSPEPFILEFLREKQASPLCFIL